MEFVERQRFEAWAKAYLPSTMPWSDGGVMARDPVSGVYMDPEIAAAWLAWSHRARGTGGRR